MADDIIRLEDLKEFSVKEYSDLIKQFPVIGLISDLFANSQWFEANSSLLVKKDTFETDIYKFSEADFYLLLPLRINVINKIENDLQNIVSQQFSRAEVSYAGKKPIFNKPLQKHTLLISGTEPNCYLTFGPAQTTIKYSDSLEKPPESGLRNVSSMFSSGPRIGPHDPFEYRPKPKSPRIGPSSKHF